MHPYATRPLAKLDLPRERAFQAGVWYSTPFSTFYPRHYHDELEINVGLWGRAQVRIGRELVDLFPGTLLWLAPGQEHALESVSPDFSMWVVSLRPEAVLSAQGRAGVDVLDGRSGHGVCQAPASRLRELSALCAEHGTREHPSEQNPVAGRFLSLALRTFQQGNMERPQAGSRGMLPHPSVARAATLLARSETHLSLQDLATACELSTTRLSRVFKEQMGLSIVQFQNHVRVQAFIRLFGRGERWNMLEAALQVGFGSYPQFFRAFRRVTGYAPAEHLHRVQAGIVTPVSIGAALSRGADEPGPLALRRAAR